MSAAAMHQSRMMGRGFVGSRTASEPRRLPNLRLIRRFAAIAAGLAGMTILLTFLLLTIVPRTGLYSTFIVLSPSMEPAIRPGAVVIVKPVSPDEIGAGDVITFTSALPPHPSLSHRVQAVFETEEGRVFKTKGDANVSLDPWEVRYAGVGGKVVLAIPLVGYVMAASSSEAARGALSVLLVGLVALLFLRTVWSRPTPKTRPESKALPAPSASRPLPLSFIRLAIVAWLAVGLVTSRNTWSER